MPEHLIRAIGALVERHAPHPGAADHAQLAAAIREITRETPPDTLLAAAEHFQERPDVAAPLLEDVVQCEPNNSRALVRLANAYWLLGSGPQPVGELASRAIAADPDNRAAWHLWALAEAVPRQRVSRWQQVAERFPDDVLALANVADNAASVAGAERDYDMVDVAIAGYEALRKHAHRAEEREAVERALATLRAWKF